MKGSNYMSNLFKFRRYKKKQGNLRVKHPKLIVDEYDDEFGYMGLTSRKKKGRGHNNYPLRHNPEFINGVRKKEQSYLRKKIEYDNKKLFGDIEKNFILHEEDKNDLIPYVNKRKKKR